MLVQGSLTPLQNTVTLELSTTQIPAGRTPKSNKTSESIRILKSKWTPDSIKTPPDSTSTSSDSRTSPDSVRTPPDSERKAPDSRRTPDQSSSASAHPTADTEDVEKSGPKGDLHLHLTAEEMRNCFVRTDMAEIKTKRKRYARFIGRTPIEATRVYRELYATTGSLATGDLKSLMWDESLPGCEVFSDRSYDEHCCALRVQVPRGMYAVVEISQIRGSTVCVYDTSSDGRRRIVNFPMKQVQSTASDNTFVFTSSSNIAYVVLVAREKRLRRRKPQSVQLAPEWRFHFRFRSVGKSGLQVKWASPNRGVVETYWHSDQTILIAPVLDPWACVQVPSDHVILVSFPTSVLSWNCVALYTGDRGNLTLLDVCFRTSPLPGPAFYNTSSLLVRFYRLFHTKSSLGLAFRGFSIRFSVHHKAVLSAKLPDGGAGNRHQWNCSAAILRRWDLLYHLSCNLKVECLAAEDESNCAYNTVLCGPGYLTLGGACFFYVETQEDGPGRQLSWEEAYDVCRLREEERRREIGGTGVAEGGRGGGVRLASLNTVAKWEEAVNVLPVYRHKYVSVFVGLSSAPAGLPLWYSGSYQWSDATIAFYVESGRVRQAKRRERRCGSMIIQQSIANKVWIQRHAHFDIRTNCGRKQTASVLCEKPILDESIQENVITINSTDRWPQDGHFVSCPAGHYTHRFLACDITTSCWSRDHSSLCSASSSPPFFTCTNQMQRVPYTLLCDNSAHCDDDSDEGFCRISPCGHLEPFSCNRQCISNSKLCDGWEDCHNGEDEHHCETVIPGRGFIPPPALVTLSATGRLILHRLHQGTALSTDLQWEVRSVCPDTHFQCMDNGYCMPVILRCNSVYDCPGHEDEAGCDTCPGYYRCRAAQVCLQRIDLCDGHAHCPQHDDEQLCESTCPPSCLCHGLAFFCRRSFPASAFPLLRFLDASNTTMSPASMKENLLLVHLALANCGLARLRGFFLPNMLSLNVQDNQLSTLSHLHLAGAPQLRELIVAGNPLALVFEGIAGVRPFRHMLKLDLSRVLLHDINVTALFAFPNLQVLNLSHCQVRRVPGVGFGGLNRLRVIDLQGCPMTWFPRGIFRGLVDLERVHAQSFKICCPAVLPLDFSLRNCFAPSDEISSCDDLLRESGYLVCVFVLSLFAVIGNAVSFIFRSHVSNRETKLGYGIFVTHLSVSDFLMGIYLSVIGGANQVYHGIYLWNDVAWKQSSVCKLAGFLSLLSSEVSALIMCLITLDRFLVIRFPLSNVHFSPRCAHAASTIVWICGALLASVPLLPVTSHWEFYSQTGICIPLPVTRSYFAGYDYSFSIVIVLNFVLFVFISVGQLCIYCSVRANSMSVANTTKKTKDLTIARRLITVAMSDFLCWFPICVLGLLASSDVPISGEVNVASAIFVLPLNAAVNPCLYSFNVIAERRSRAREEKLRALLLAQLKARG